MTTRLYLVRHGATPLTAEDRFSGSENVHLSEEGRAQVTRLAKRLKDDSIDAIYCSPLDRTLETASIIAKPQHICRSRFAWSWVRAGASPLLSHTASWLPVVQGGLGATIPVGATIAGPASIDVDAGLGAIGLSPIASVGARLRLQPAPLLNVSVGPELRLMDPAVVRAAPWALDLGGAGLWPGVVVGVSL